MKNEILHYKGFWVVIGLLMIAFVVVETLTPSPIGMDMGISDKVYHLLGYFGMMGWFVQIVRSRNQRLLLGAGFIGMGIALEYLQGWGGIRHYEMQDMFANASGVVLAWLLSFSRFANVLIKIESVFTKQDTTHM